MRTIMINLAIVAVLGVMTRPAGAMDDSCGGQACCDKCGCPCDCLQKTCQLVCDVKKEKKTCWCVECQEFCTLLPGCPHLCCECAELPHCGHSKCVKKLVKKDYEVAVPVYKCVVVYLCPACCKGGSTNNVPDTLPNPQSAPTAPAAAPLSPPPPPRPAPPTT